MKLATCAELQKKKSHSSLTQQSVVLSCKEWLCKDSVHAHEVLKLVFHSLRLHDVELELGTLQEQSQAWPKAVSVPLNQWQS